MSMNIVTRYAPSPTGNPHVGNIRTAIFAYLHAKSRGGKFLLRIEDTDRARFVPEAIKYIEESLEWLGIEYDNEKIFQSDRLDVYQKKANELLEKGIAYKCFCSSERLEKLKREQKAAGMAPGYDKCCRNLSKEHVAEKLEAEEPYVIRFAMPEKGVATWDDLVRGNISIDYAEMDDFVILKSDGWPTYHLANVVDDKELGISDVIRGEEWIPSTPKHIALYKSFGWEPPRFGHLPLIVGQDKAKLSKRHGDTAILDYREKGYLPEAMLNFLVMLGWSDGTEKEIFSHKELLKSFDVKRIGKSPAVFDLEKLNWLNGQYIRSTPTSILKSQISNLLPSLNILKLDNFDKILEVEKTRLTTLCDIQDGTGFYTKVPEYKADTLVFKKSTPQTSEKGLRAALEGLKQRKKIDSVEDYNDFLAKIVENEKLTNGDVFWPVRVALSGLEKSPSPAELLWVLDANETENRLENALLKLQSLTP